MEDRDINKIVLEFETFCKKNDLAALASNSRLANKYAKKIINSYLKLKELNKSDELSKLLKSENDNVRLWAATHTLTTNEKAATNVLLALSAKPGLNALSAEMTLRLWGEGKLKLEYGDFKIEW